MIAERDHHTLSWLCFKRLFLFLGRGHFQGKYMSGLSVGKIRHGQMVDALGAYNLPVPVWFQMPGDIFWK